MNPDKGHKSGQYFLDLLATARAEVDAFLERRVAHLGWHPSSLEDCIYVMRGAGKALRPALVLFAFDQTRRDGAEASPFVFDCALAVEMVHTYSLVHDDLPAMDNDDSRRGKATLHKKYSDARAILSGDALLTGAFEILSSSSGDPQQIPQAVLTLAKNSGASGMISGQMRDMFESAQGLSVEENLSALSRVHAEKTGALIAASLELGLIAAGASHETRSLIRSWGLKLGLLFQVVDDILDATQSSAVLGKSAGKDEKSQKRTYVSLLGIDGARALAEKTFYELKVESKFFRNSEQVETLLRFVLDRSH